MAESFQPPLGSREERIAYNESWSRSLNETRAEWVLGREVAPDFRCECWQKDCQELISLSTTDWKLVREKPSQFAVSPDHVAQGFEAVIKTFPNFWLIQKFGEAGEVAKQLASVPGPDTPD